MFGRRLLVELAPCRLLVELAAPFAKQGVQVRRITRKITELALVREAIRVHEGGSCSTEKEN